MDNKRIFVSLIFLMFLVGISFVSAQDISSLEEVSSMEVDDLISVDDTVDDVSTSDVGEDVISDSESTQYANSWADLKSDIEDASVDAVKLNASGIAPSSSSSDQISINHDITIVGGYGYYIGNADWNSAASYDYIPMITSGNNLNVNFENVTFQYLSNNIFIKLMGNGNYAFKNCVFNNINCTGSHQSVIWLNYGYALIENCTFTNVTSSFGAVTNYYTSWGTAVNNARMTVRDSTFKDNYANTEPGAINNCGKLEVYDSIFENNRAEWWAGAIHTHSNANTTVVRSNFRNNIAGWNGGALYSYSYLTVINSTFTANEAHQTTGGAIAASTYGSRPTIVIENCDFDDNLAYGRGGAVYVTNAGYLNVYYSNFVNNTGSEGNDIAYYYTAKKNNAAFLTYDYNEFWGADNSSGSIYAYDTQYLVVNNGTHNVFHDISEYVDPGEENITNDTNASSGTIIVPDSFNGVQLWNASLSGALGGSPLVSGERIYVPNGQSIYCLNVTNGALLWNVSSEWGYFHELGLHNRVLVAPCAWDKFYMFDAVTGSEIQPTSNIYQASSYYAPAIDGNTIYVSSEYPYGVNNNSWIAVIKYENNVYSYVGSILEINNASSTLISQPIVRNGYLWVNTINGLMCVDLSTNTSSIVLANTVGKPVVGGDIIYVLTSDNHICGVNTSGDVVADITIEGDVGSTLAINNDNTILYTVNANGEIYLADISSNASYCIYQINPVSSALTVGSDDNLYIGDDEGIFWVMDPYTYDYLNWYTDIMCTYNAYSSILSTPLINNGVIYIGTDNAFYSLSGSSINLFYLKSNNPYSKNNQGTYSNELLGTSLNDILGDNSNIVYLNPKKLSDNEFLSDTVYYLNEGIYNITDTIVWCGGPQATGAKKNITIKPNGTANVIINFLTTKTSASQQRAFLNVYFSNNITLENLKFTAGSGFASSAAFFTIMESQNITFKKCTFENMNSKGNTACIMSIISSTNQNTDNINIENCKFIDCSAQNILSIGNAQKKNVKLVSISDCNFENCVVTNYVLAITVNSNIYLTNNTFDSVVPITLNGGTINSDVSFNVLTKTLTANTNNDIVAELVDDNGKHIYASGLKFMIDDDKEGVTPSFDKTTGLYTYSYLTPELGTVSVMASCSNIKDFQSEEVTLNIVNSPELTINATDSITYGATAVYVNATLKEDVTGENVTFTLSKGGTVYNSTTVAVNNGFASAVFNNKLNVGSYTLSVSYGGSANYGAASDSKSLVVNKATPNFIITVNEVFTVADNITVTVSVPEECEGKMFVGIYRGIYSIIEGKYDIPVTSGDIFNVTFNPVSANNYLIRYGFDSTNSNFESISSNQKESYWPHFKVVKVDSNLTVKADDVDWGNNVTVSITTDSRFTGNITVKLGDDEKVAEIKEGSGSISFANLKADTYNITAKFNETDLFAPSQNDINVTVNKVNATLTLEDIVFDWDKSGSTSVSYSGATDVEVVIVETGASIPVQDNAITVSNLKADTYTLRVTTVPDENHTQTTKTVTIKVNKVNSTLTLGDDITFDYGNSNSTTVSFTGAVNVETVVVGRQASVEIKDGIITVSALDAGDYTLNVTTVPDENHTSVSKTVNIKVNKVDSDINIMNPVDYVYGNVGQCSVLSQGVINFTAVIVDHPEANITIYNGIVNISGLKVGNYTLRVTANPDKNHNSIFRECNVTVKMAEIPADQAVNVTAPADSQSPTFSINLDDESAEGNFTVYVDGKEWGTVKVVNGSASITVANLPAGNHNITTSYSGDDNHAAIVQNTTLAITAPAKTTDTTTPAKTTTKITLTLKKVKVKRSAKKLVIKATLKINGKAAKNKWLKFKFNKKTYKAKTNKKGVAKITVKKAVLKKLKAGKKVKYQVTYGKKTVKKTVKVKK